MYNINNLPPLTILKFVLDNNVLRVSDFCEGLAPILLITSLSKDKVPSVEKPYADFIIYGNVNKLSPIEPIETKHCLLLGTNILETHSRRSICFIFVFHILVFESQEIEAFSKVVFNKLECFYQIWFSSI